MKYKKVGEFEAVRLPCDLEIKGHDCVKGDIIVAKNGKLDGVYGYKAFARVFAPLGNSKTGGTMVARKTSFSPCIPQEESQDSSSCNYTDTLESLARIHPRDELGNYLRDQGFEPSEDNLMESAGGPEEHTPEE